MKLSTEIKENLKYLDYEYGGGIKTKGTQVDVIDKPILIVGLGGTGVESLIRVKKSINHYFKPGVTASGHRMDKPANVEYLAIDSDDNLSNLKYKGISFSKENDEFILLENANLMSIYRNRDSVFKDLTKDWVSNNLRLQQIKHGAGGIRQAGRFLLFINVNSVISAISEKINRLTLNRNSKDLLYVFILTGTSGGTGGGTFMDIPYLIRRIADMKGFETENIGMIFLPDVTLSDNSIDGAAALNIKANGFAALKELDYLMNLERNDEYFDQTYSDIDIHTNEPPYDLCHLISSKDESGKTMANAKNYCMNVAAETVINFIASEEVMDGQNYTITSYLSNIENNRYTFLMTHSQKQPTNYIYNIVGASCAVLPVDFLTNHLTYRVFRELEDMFDRTPTAADIDQTMQALGLDLGSVEAELKNGRPRMRDLSRYDYGILNERPDIVDDALKNDVINHREHLEQKVRQILDGLRQKLEDPNNILMQHFADFELGPFYTRRETSASNEVSVLKNIESLRKRNIVQRREPKDVLDGLELKKQLAQDKLNYRRFFFRQRLADDVINTAEDYHKAVMRNDVCDALDSIYETAYQLLYDYGYRIVDTQCELLLALKTLFDKYKDPEKKSQDADMEEAFTWDMVSAEEFCKYISESRELELTFDSRAVLKQFLLELAAEPAKWVLDTRANLAQEVNDFISRELEGVMDKSMDYYLGLMAGEVNKSMEQYVGEKLEELKATAKVMFPSSHVPSGLNIEFPPYSYVSVPTNAPSLRSNAKRLSSTGRISNVKYSKLTNRLYMLNLKIAVALYCYRELNDYESVYEASLNKMAGIHLYEGPVKNWRNLPSPNYDKLWTAGYENQREREKNRRIRQTFDKALDYGYIVFDERNDRYVCRYGEIIDVFSKFRFDEEELHNKAIPPSRARTLCIELKKYLDDRSRLKHEKALYDIVYLQDQITPDTEYAKGVLIYMPELADRVEAQVAHHEQVLEMIHALERVEEAERKYSDFAQILYMDKIYKVRKNYKYALSNKEFLLYTQENIQENYVDYQLFQAFLALKPADAAQLQKLALAEENGCSEEEYERVIARIDGFKEEYTRKLGELKVIYREERDGVQKLGFYQMMVDVFARAAEILK